jgi:hypothetical protein
MNGESSSNDIRVTEREVTSVSSATTPDTVAAPKSSRKKGTVRKSPAPPPKGAPPLESPDRPVSTDQETATNYLPQK